MSGREKQILCWMLLVCISLTALTAAATEPEWPVAVTILLDRFDLASRDELGPVPAVENYLGYAVANHPEIEAGFHRWQAARAVSGRVGGLPDPRFSYGEMMVPVQTRVGPQERMFSLSQTVPWFGSLSLHAEAADQHAAAAAARLEAVVLQVLLQVRTALAELAFLEHAIRLTGEHLDLLTQWEAATRAQYEAGAGLYAAIIQAQVELGQQELRLAELHDLRRPLRAALDRALGRPVTLVTESKHPSLSLPIPRPADRLLPDELAQRLRHDHPSLRALEREQESQRSAEKLAARQRYPDLTVGLDYIQTGQALDPGLPDSGADPVIARFSINLPLWQGKRDAARQEAAGLALSLAARRRDRENELMTRLTEVLARYREAYRTHDLYTTNLLPRQHQALEAVTAAYSAGGSSFRDLATEQRILLEFELAVFRARADCLIQWSALESLLCHPIPSLRGVDPSEPTATSERGRP